MAQKRDWLRNAFAVSPNLEPPTEEQRQLVEKLSREIVKRHLTQPALAFLEMSRPMNFLGAQAMHFFAPLLTTVLDKTSYDLFSKFLERRDSIDIWCDQIDQIANEPTRAPDEPSDQEST